MSVMSDTALQAAPASKARGYWATVGRRIVRDKVSMVCAFILVLIFASALLAPWLGLADPYQGSMIRRLRHIGTPNYPLGTDELGRDMLARLRRRRPHHHARAHARHRARPDLRLRHGPDLGVDDSGRGSVVPRPRDKTAGAGMGLDAQHAAHRDLRQPVGGGTAGRDDLC